MNFQTLSNSLFQFPLLRFNEFGVFHSSHIAAGVCERAAVEEWDEVRTGLMDISTHLSTSQAWGITAGSIACPKAWLSSLLHRDLVI